MSLPCRHILKFREICNLPLFEQELCLERWTRAQGNQVSIQNNVLKSITKNKPLSNHQKFKLMNAKCLKLAEISSEVSSTVFYERLNFIKQLVQKWSESNTLSSDSNINSNNCGNEIGYTLTEAENIDQGNQEANSNIIEYYIDTNNNDFSTSTVDTAICYDNETDQIIINTNSNIIKDIKSADTNSCNDETVTQVAVNFDANNYNEELSNIKIPSIKVRGRPRGFANTVVGLKRKTK
ncbi:hypothetical protein ABEB36_014952 [Hypothenemus hampei]|uniref:Uncharacterized protein n=1 Tax=Hypothenemus hampei TaxID=57062 RepID=A0ABD1E2B6_HYPHA